jgi:hypothetical protein
MQNAINIDHANRVIWFPLELQSERINRQGAKEMRVGELNHDGTADTTKWLVEKKRNRRWTEMNVD